MPNTLRSLRADGGTIYATCSNWRGGCTHAAEVSIDSLIQHLGWDFPYVAERKRLLDALVCSHCGHNQPQIQRTQIISRGAGQGGHSQTSTQKPGDPTYISYDEALRRAMEFRKEHPEPPMKYGGKNRRRWGR
jgi:hypothetical protein